jgi:hypothetical protein
MIANNTGTMTLGGETRPYKVDTIRQQRAFTDSTGAELGEMQLKLNELDQLYKAEQLTTKAILDALPVITAYAWSALYAGAWQASKQCAFSYKDVQEWVEDSNLTEVLPELLKPLATLGAVYTEKKTGQIG